MMKYFIVLMFLILFCAPINELYINNLDELNGLGISKESIVKIDTIYIEDYMAFMVRYK